MANFMCDRCGRGFESLTNAGTVSIGDTGVGMYGFYVFCPECLDIIRKTFREMRFKAIEKDIDQ